MSDQKVPVETLSELPQQIDPNADLMKARPGGETDIGTNPATGYDDMKPASTFEGTGSEGGYEKTGDKA
jgi:hypothetical protein